MSTGDSPSAPGATTAVATESIGQHGRRSRSPRQAEVTVQRVGLVLLYPPETSLAGAQVSTAQLVGFSRRVGLWPGFQLAWQPPAEGQDAPWLAADAVVPVWRDLRSHGLTAASRSPAFTIYTIARMHAEVPQRVKRMVARQRRRAMHSGDPLPRDPSANAERAALDQMIAELGIPEVDAHTGVSPAFYSHFDRNVNTRGWLVVTPTCAVLAGVSAGEVATLATLLQPRDIGPGGILPDRYDEVISRIEQWNGTQDVFEAVSQLESLITGGQRSTDGQLWLNFALAAIGVVLTLFASPQFGGEQVLSLALLALASVGFALYARGGSFAFQVAGWVAFAASIAVTASVLLHTHIPLLSLHLP